MEMELRTSSIGMGQSIISRYILRRAPKECGVTVTLEGGYDPKRTGLGVKAVLRALAAVDLDR